VLGQAIGARLQVAQDEPVVVPYLGEDLVGPPEPELQFLLGAGEREDGVAVLAVEREQGERDEVGGVFWCFDVVVRGAGAAWPGEEDPVRVGEGEGQVPFEALEARLGAGNQGEGGEG